MPCLLHSLERIFVEGPCHVFWAFTFWFNLFYFFLVFVLVVGAADVWADVEAAKVLGASVMRPVYNAVTGSGSDADKDVARDLGQTSMRGGQGSGQADVLSKRGQD